MSSSLSFRTTPARVSTLDELVRATERPRTWHLERALAMYLDQQAWQVREIKAGLAELDRGETISHDDMAAWIESWGTTEEQSPPR